jgi:hypothetical protein
MKKPRHILKLALLSGALSFMLVWLSGDMPGWLRIPDDLPRYSPGLVFGLLVLAVPAMAQPAGWLRAIAVIACSTLIYFLMVRLASHLATSGGSELAACGIAGGLGAMLTALAIRLLLSRPLSLLAVVMAFVLGTLGGCLIGQAVQTPDIDALVRLLVLAGFLLWQGGVAFALLLVDPLGEAPDQWPPGDVQE